jgi:ERCC4-type nuclease
VALIEFSKRLQELKNKNTEEEERKIINRKKKKKKKKYETKQHKILG